MPAVSVILPVYHAHATVAVAIESILSQTYTEFELLLVDDGSTDGSLDILARYATQDSRIRVIRIAHGGPAAAMNAGISEAKGIFIARMDADDFSHPGRLEKQVAFLQDHPETGMVSCMIEYGGDRASQLGYALHVDWINGLVSPDEIRKARFVDLPVAHPSVMFRKSCVEKFGSYDEGPLPEDYEILLRWVDAGVQVAKVPEVLFTWNDPPTRISRNHANYSDEAFAKTKARYLSRWLQKHNPNHPEVIVWGAGKKSRKRVEHLVQKGIVVKAYIDIKPRNLNSGIPVFHFGETDRYGDAFVLAYVNKRGAREEIREWLVAMGLVEERDFLLC